MTITSSKIAKRQRMERSIARAFIRSPIAAGYTINVDNGGDEYELPTPTNSLRTVMKTMFATDDERLYLFKNGQPDPFGWVYFTYGESGWDVICDYTINLEPLMGLANKLSDKYQDQE